MARINRIQNLLADQTI